MNTRHATKLKELGLSTEEIWALLKEVL